MNTDQPPHVRLAVTMGARTADVVVPASLTPAELVPQVMDLLDQRPPVGRSGMYTDLGHQLDPEAAVATQGLLDGQRVRILPVPDAPPEPVVHDLVDRIAGHRTAGLWGPVQSRRVGAALGTANALTTLAVLPDAPWLPWAVAAALLMATLVLHTLRRTDAGWFTLTGAGISLAYAVLTGPSPGHWLVSPMLAVALVTLLVGHLAGHLRGALFTLATLASAVLLGLAVHAWLGQPASALALAVLSLVGIGLVPRWSMLTSGLYGLADETASGEASTVRHVEEVVRETYAVLLGTIVVLAAVQAWALVALAPRALDNRWLTAFAVASAVAFALRARHFPLGIHRLLLWAASLTGVLAAALSATTRWPSAAPWIAAGMTVVALAVLLRGLAPAGSPLHQARSRRFSGGLERVCVLATLPCAAGALGLYSRLLETF